jgi:predicted cobalt transporter CbtA
MAGAPAPITEQRFIARGIGAGAIGGLAAFVFARIFAEPQIQAAIDYEGARGEAEHLLDKAAGIAVAAHEHADPFSRGIQEGIGIGFGLVLIGVALGGIFSVVFVLAQRHWPKVSPRAMAMYVAFACFLALFLLPFLKYPTNPPAIGHEDTIRERSLLYLAMVVISIAAVWGFALAAERLAKKYGTWNGVLLALLGFAIAFGVVMYLMPVVGHLEANVSQYGRHDTETPLPLLDAAGNVVYPGFPADVLAKFRLYAVGNQLVLWATMGLVFGVLAERLMRSAVTERSEPAADAVPASS